MGSCRQWGLVILWLWLLTLPVRMTHADVSAGEPLVIVAGRAFPGTDISFVDLKSAFGGQPIKVGGTALIPINQPLGAPARVVFDRATLGLEPDAVGRFWVDMRIRDQGKPPVTATTTDLAVRVVAALPGAISYATSSSVLPTVKVLTVDGKSVGQHGYVFELVRP